MNKFILICTLATVLLTVGCKKDRDRVSQVVDISFPTITINGQSVTAASQDDYYTHTIGPDQTGFVSIKPGESLAVTGFDSALNETVDVSIDSDGGFDANTAGLYIIDYSAKNRNGYHTLGRFYVGVTNVQNSMLEGNYTSDHSGGTFAVRTLAPGLYLNTDAAADAYGVYGVMLQVDNNTVVMPEQSTGLNPNTDSGPFAWGFGNLSLTPDTTIMFSVINDFYDPSDTITITRIGPL